MTKIFIIAILLFSMQSLGGFLQVKNYKQAVRRLHSLGTIGIGQRKSGFFSSYIIIIASDVEGIIVGCEALDGIFVFSKFKSVSKFNKIDLESRKVTDVINEVEDIDSKYNSGLKNALNALNDKLTEQVI